jgi:hypothetical protein
VVKDTRVGALDVGVEARVERADGRPVEVERLDVLVRDTSAHVGLLEGGADGSHRGLRGHSRHTWGRGGEREDNHIDDGGLTVDGDVDDISSSSGTGEHTGGRDTGSVVRVDVDGEVGELGANGSDEAVRRRISRR